MPHIPPRALKILFVASECAPLAKVGGLADVVAALPRALRRLGHDARVLLPLYGSIDRARFGITPAGSACVHMGGGEEAWMGLLSARLHGEVPVWFVDYARFFARPGIYDEGGVAYGDNAQRFALLSKAALQVCKDQGFIPDVVHVHDWPTALCCAYLKTWDRILSPLSRTASVLTLHNIGYQGRFHASAYAYIGVGSEHWNSDCFEDHGGLNLLKGGIAFADAITTVSPSYAREIVTPPGGHGMEPYLQRRAADFSGILNGADYEHWDPGIDPHLPARYSADDLSGKAACKTALQERMGLTVQPELPILGVVTRFAEQKGIGLLIGALPWALSTMEMQVVVLGSGDPDDERFFRWLARSHPGRAACHIGYSEELSHLIQAGSDFLLVPSLYEPCGLTQMYAMRYGTLPVVRATGGLDDTVDNYNEQTGEGTGFKFHTPSPEALYDTIGWAVSTWFDRPVHIALLRQSAMAQEFGWPESAREYVAVYERAVHNRRTHGPG
jgi:starch synthase